MIGKIPQRGSFGGVLELEAECKLGQLVLVQNTLHGNIMSKSSVVGVVLAFQKKKNRSEKWINSFLGRARSGAPHFVKRRVFKYNPRAKHQIMFFW